jgi:signal transduction histidine kinase
MKLSEFIRVNIPAISREWEKFAATLVPEKKFSRSVLRDGIVEILEQIANDVERPRGQKPRNRAAEEPDERDPIVIASKRHAEDRTRMGIATPQLLSEFCALRATVIHMWQANENSADRHDVETVLRFNEAVDEIQMVAAQRYHETNQHSRDLFLAILGHDLRNPLAAILGATEAQQATGDPGQIRALAAQIMVTVKRMSRMVADLLELTRVSQGKAVPLELKKVDMNDICRAVLEEMKVAHPEQRFSFRAEQSLVGEWDEQRMAQVISNLIGNAVCYGKAERPVSVTARSVENGVEVAVHNEGPVIPPDLMPRLFDTFVRGEPAPGAEAQPGLGLGLYIAKEIVVAHGGSIDAVSSEQDGNTFFFFLPQSARNSPGER